MSLTVTTITYSVLVCDGCGQRYGDGDQHPNAMSVRAVAYGAGWRYPSKVGSTGNTMPNRTSDVCPTCIDGWVPQTAGKRRP